LEKDRKKILSEEKMKVTKEIQAGEFICNQRTNKELIFCRQWYRRKRISESL
jgi:hypothetical protein